MDSGVAYKKTEKLTRKAKYRLGTTPKMAEKTKGKRTKKQQELQLLCPIRKSFEPTWLKCTGS